MPLSRAETMAHKLQDASTPDGPKPQTRKSRRILKSRAFNEFRTARLLPARSAAPGFDCSRITIERAWLAQPEAAPKRAGHALPNSPTWDHATRCVTNRAQPPPPPRAARRRLSA